MKSAACLRYGIRAKPCMESTRSVECNQSEGEIHADAWCHTPSAITYSPAVRLHTNPSDWIEKRPFENGLFSWVTPTILNLYLLFLTLAWSVAIKPLILSSLLPVIRVDNHFISLSSKWYFLSATIRIWIDALTNNPLLIDNFFIVSKGISVI